MDSNSVFILLGVHDRYFSWGNVPGCNRNHEVLERKYTVKEGSTATLFQVKREFCEIRVTLNICDFLGGGGSDLSLSSFLLDRRARTLFRPRGTTAPDPNERKMCPGKVMTYK